MAFMFHYKTHQLIQLITLSDSFRPVHSLWCPIK